MELKWFWREPVSIKGDGGVGGGRSNSSVGSQDAINLAAEFAENRTFVERVDDEDGRLEHLYKIEDRQSDHQHVGRCPQRFSPNMQTSMLNWMKWNGWIKEDSVKTRRLRCEYPNDDAVANQRADR